MNKQIYVTNQNKGIESEWRITTDFLLDYALNNKVTKNDHSINRTTIIKYLKDKCNRRKHLQSDPK